MSYQVNGCLLGFHGTLAAGFAIEGGLAALVTTTAAVSTVFLAAGLFAAPAIAACAFTLAAPLFMNVDDNSSQFTKSLYYLSCGALFTLVSAAVLTTAIFFGVLSAPLILHFAISAGILSFLLFGFGVSFCFESRRQGTNPLSIDD